MRRSVTGNYEIRLQQASLNTANQTALIRHSTQAHHYAVSMFVNSKNGAYFSL